MNFTEFLKSSLLEAGVDRSILWIGCTSPLQKYFSSLFTCIKKQA